MVLKTKFDLGDKVYFIQGSNTTYDAEICPFCRGDGWVTASSGIRLACKNCEGTGEIVIPRVEILSRKVYGIVRYVDCSENNRGEKHISYKLNINGTDDYRYFSEKELHNE